MDEKAKEGTDFCTELHEKTKDIHDKSDKLINLKLAVVLTNKEAWGQAVGQFYYVFQTIEQCIKQHLDHPNVSPLYIKDLERTKAFEKDLQYYLGSDWQGKLELTEPTKKYCDRIIAAAKEDPTLLVAYSHSMYLALLAGGQIIKRIVRKTLGLPNEEGLAIFDFPGSDRKDVKDHLKYNINCLDLTRSQKDMILKEKRLCFQMNNAIAESVQLKPSSFKRLFMLLILLLAGFLLILFLFLYLFYF